MKLTDSRVFEGKLTEAWTEPTWRQKDIEDSMGVFVKYDPQRFQFVVDEEDEVLATVSDDYLLIQNRELVSALDMAAEDLGIVVDPLRGSYVNGRSNYTFTIPKYSQKIGNDPSETIMTLNLRNDYRGGGSLKMLAGWFRIFCENGQVVGEVAAEASRRHVGTFNPFEWIHARLARIGEQFEANLLIAEVLADTSHESSAFATDFYRGREGALEAVAHGDASLVEQILADTAERYHKDFRAAAQRNFRDIGHNLWALAQAVSEVATHRLQQTATGKPRAKYNTAADAWGTAQYNRIVEYARR